MALAVFGKNTTGAERYGFYLEAVSSGLPPLPGGYQGRCADIPGSWKVIRPKTPEIHDLVVTKLKRFHAKDREDVQILCDTGEVEEETLRNRFDSAYMWDDQDDPKTIAASTNLESVLDYLRGERRSL